MASKRDWQFLDPTLESRRARSLIAESERLSRLTSLEAVDTAQHVIASLNAIAESRQFLEATASPLAGGEMDRTLVMEHLTQAERHIAEGEGRIRHQLQIIAQLERDGHDSVVARQLLDTLERSQALQIEQRELIVAELKSIDSR